MLLLPGERSVFQINAEQAAALKQARAGAWQGLDAEGKRQLIRKTIGVAQQGEPVVTKFATVERPNCTVEKLVLTVAAGVRVPALAFVPKQPSGKAVLYRHGGSMKADAAPGGAIDPLVNGGETVLAAELRGFGETETGVGKRTYGGPASARICWKCLPLI